MLNSNNIKSYEIEATTRCNAACPGCPRYAKDSDKLADYIKLQDIKFLDFKNIFADTTYLNNKYFNFCGSYGDPLANKEIFEIIEYISNIGKNNRISLSTNASLRDDSFWTNLGKLSLEHNKKHNKNLDVFFAVDGYKKTNHLYRINTDFDKISNNMEIYSKNGGTGKWKYIVFNHNVDEIEVAKTYAERLGFLFECKISARNYFHNAQKMPKANQYQSTQVPIEYTYKSEKSIDDVKKDIDSKNYTAKQITCRWIHKLNLFIGADMTLWPCCFLYDTVVQFKHGVKRRDALWTSNLLNYIENKNSLRKFSIEQILNFGWFNKSLEKSFDPNNNLHHALCWINCGDNGIRGDKIAR